MRNTERSCVAAAPFALSRRNLLPAGLGLWVKNKQAGGNIRLPVQDATAAVPYGAVIVTVGVELISNGAVVILIT